LPRWTVLASDFDGTLATEGWVPVETLAAVARFRAAGGRLVLVTGRRLPELYEVFPETDRVADLVVAENGCVLHDAAGHAPVLLGASPPEDLKDVLVSFGLVDVEIGEHLVSGWRYDEDAVRRAAEALGDRWPCQVVPNKDRVMLIPADVDKGSGLRAAMAHLGVEAHEVAAIGDGENDLPLIQAAGLGIAVADAVPALLEVADLCTDAPASAGVVEAIETLLRS
jgi:hydroxymethylpyrimidine pyrophosphatase-like HAD family hydrolase